MPTAASSPGSDILANANLSRIATSIVALLKMASRNVLTGLFNRRAFDDLVKPIHHMAKRSRRPYCVIVIDLDGFKALNDRLGHEVGDRLLTRVGERLKACVRKGDTVARLGGDEFLVLAIDLESERDVRLLVEKLLAAPRRPSGWFKSILGKENQDP